MDMGTRKTLSYCTAYVDGGSDAVEVEKVYIAESGKLEGVRVGKLELGVGISRAH